MPQAIPFTKLSGAGNDFIAVARNDVQDLDPGRLARCLCTRAQSIGADGLIIVEPGDENGVNIHFYNPDGSLAEACGNGSRCAARYAVEHRLVKSSNFSLFTDSGDLPVQAEPDGRFRVTMPTPHELTLHYTQVEHYGHTFDVHALQVGVPHAVVVVENVERLDNADLVHIGRSLRYSAEFPAGVNTNFAQILPSGIVRQRTYERGVENLTMACGTGSTATAHVLRHLHDVDMPVRLQVDGGELTIDLADDGSYWLVGNARVVATGVVSPEAFEW